MLKEPFDDLTSNGSKLVEKGKAFSDKRGLRFALRLGVHLR